MVAVGQARGGTVDGCLGRRACRERDRGGDGGRSGAQAGLDRDQVGVEDPRARARAMPAMTAAGLIVRCSNRTPTRARVPAPSPSCARAWSQKCWWTGVKVPAARAPARAVDPASAPGLRSRTSR